MTEKLLGQLLDGRYLLEELLGTGAMGAVYRGKQTAVDRTVAVKTLHAFLQNRDDFKARFEIEAKAVARLNHPNCITLFDYGFDGEHDVFYMVLEFVDGELLADVMTREMDYMDILSIVYQAGEALETAHRQGILHRDLKPENIMISRSATSGRPIVKVLDFGLARLFEQKVQEGVEAPGGRYKQITEAGQVYGTPAYMSPEQCRGRGEITPATDIYALGTMMFELLEGHLPFFSQSTAELILMQMTEDPPEMENTAIPKDIRDLVHRMMRKNPAERPQTASDVLMALLPHVQLDASQELRVRPEHSQELRFQWSDERPVMQTTWSTRSKRQVVLLGLGTLLLCAVAVILAMASRGPEESTPHAAASVDAGAEPVASSDAGTSSDEVVAAVEEGTEPKGEVDSPAPSKSTRPKRKAKKKEKEAPRPKTIKLTY